MQLRKITLYVTGIITFYSTLALPTYGQKTFVKDVSKTEDKRYIAQVDASPTEVSLLDRSGLVKEITLGIEWWTLLNEPIEKYLIRWKRGNSVYSPTHYTYLSESSLAKYPDLLKRFKSLKPSYIGIEISVYFDFGDSYSTKNQDFFKTLPECIRKSEYAQISGKTFYDINNKHGVRNINSNGHFYIVKSGATGDDISPGGPKDWTQFIQYGNCHVGNNAASGIFKLSTSASFSIKITSIKVPEREIDAIAAEYKKREEGEDKKPTEEEASKEDENANESWDLSDNETSNDGWSKNSNLADSDSKSSSNNSSWASAKSGDSSWGKTSDDSDADNYKVEYRNGKYGVVSKNGSILIPFNYDQIENFHPKDGMAKVWKQNSSKKYEIDCYFDGTITVYTGKSGFVDQSGNWVVEPENVASIITSYSGWNGISLFKSDCDYDCQQRWKEKWRRESKICSREVSERREELENYYAGQGYKIK